MGVVCAEGEDGARSHAGGEEGRGQRAGGRRGARVRGWLRPQRAARTAVRSPAVALKSGALLPTRGAAAFTTTALRLRAHGRRSGGAQISCTRGGGSAMGTSARMDRVGG